jgi:hypothetical protein
MPKGRGFLTEAYASSLDKKKDELVSALVKAIDGHLKFQNSLF